MIEKKRANNSGEGGCRCAATKTNQYTNCCCSLSFEEVWIYEDSKLCYWNVLDKCQWATATL